MATPKCSPCNQCGLNPKYPSQGLCRECFFEKRRLQWIASRPPKKEIPTLRGEKWANIENAPGYLISNMGRVKSLNHHGELGRHGLLQLRESRKGSYLKVDIDKYNWRPSVHRLVGLYFVPNPHNYPIVLHKDDDKQNNKYTNLVWGTHSKNNKDYDKYRIKNGIPRIKLTAKSALKIFKSSDTVQNLAEKFGITPASVWSIKTGRTWCSVTGLQCSRKYKSKL